MTNQEIDTMLHATALPHWQAIECKVKEVGERIEEMERAHTELHAMVSLLSGAIGELIDRITP